jgi:hypothetical protein
MELRSVKARMNRNARALRFQPSLGCHTLHSRSVSSPFPEKLHRQTLRRCGMYKVKNVSLNARSRKLEGDRRSFLNTCRSASISP